MKLIDRGLAILYDTAAGEMLTFCSRSYFAVPEVQYRFQSRRVGLWYRLLCALRESSI